MRGQKESGRLRESVEEEREGRGKRVEKEREEGWTRAKERRGKERTEEEMGGGVNRMNERRVRLVSMATCDVQSDES